MKTTPLLLCLVVLAGCAKATMYPQITATATVPCSGASCDQKMRQAQAWLAIHSAYKIRLATDTVVETFGPLPYHFGDPIVEELGFTIVREPMRIVVKGTCPPATERGCFFDPTVQTNRLAAALM